MLRLFSRKTKMRIAVDTETYGLNWRQDAPFFVSVITDREGAFSFDLRSGFDSSAQELLRQLLNDADEIFMHNAKFDIHALDKIGIWSSAWWPKTRDTIVREYLIDEHRVSYALDEIAFDRLGRNKIDIVQETGIKPEHWFSAPFASVKRYCEQDARLTLEIGMAQDKALNEQSLRKIERLEMDTLEAVHSMEARGVRVDVDRAEQARLALHRQMMQLLSEIYRKFGKISPSSSLDLARTLQLKYTQGQWKTPDGHAVPKTERGAPRLDEATLRSLPGELPQMVLNFKYLDKMANTFLAKHIIASANSGYVQPNINSTKSLSGRGTGTGRLSYDSPALQQIPSRKADAAALIKPIFLPDPDERWIYGDLDQNEFRVFAHFTGSRELFQAYADDPKTDFHGMVAQITGLPRKASRAGEANAKQVNLGLLFNMGSGLLAKTMGLPYTEKDGRLIPGEEVKEVLERYHSAIPGVREINRKCSQLAETYGYVTTLTGRRIRLPDPEFAYKAAGLMFQAVAADNNKRNLVLLHRGLQQLGEGRVLMNVHDEYSLSLPDTPQANEFLKWASNTIGDAGLKVPLSIEFSSGVNWYEAL